MDEQAMKFAAVYDRIKTRQTTGELILNKDKSRLGKHASGMTWRVFDGDNGETVTIRYFRNEVKEIEIDVPGQYHGIFHP